MLVIIMAGGRGGSRMGGTEKAMLEVCGGAPIIEREVEACRIIG